MVVVFLLEGMLVTCRSAKVVALAVAAAGLAGALLAVPAAPAHAETLSLTLDPNRTTIRWVLHGFPDTVRGTFKLYRGELHFDPASGAAAGCIRIDARSGESGNCSRDRRMHDEVLESARYSLVTLRPTRLVGPYPPSAGGELALSGVVSLRGSTHAVTLSVRVATANGDVTADARLPIPYVAWGLKDPSVLIFRASKIVIVDLHAVGSVTLAATALAPPGCEP